MNEEFELKDASQCFEPPIENIHFEIVPQEYQREACEDGVCRLKALIVM